MNTTERSRAATSGASPESCDSGRESPQGPIRILVVDNHEVLRLGLTALFQTVPHIQIVGEAATAADAVREVLRIRPDIVLLDLRLPDASGVEACRDILSALPQTRVLIFSSYADEEAAVAAVAAGAAGYLLKDVDPELLIQAVESVARGGSLLDPAVAGAVLGWFRELSATAGGFGPLASLNDGERRVMQLVVEGKTNREIGLALHLTKHTVKAHVSSILRKLNAARRTELIAIATRRERFET